MMEQSPCLAIQLGMEVNIKRSDGRIHSAKVCNIVTGTNSSPTKVKVEWIEKKETKGKELDIQEVISMNPKISAHYIRQPTETVNVRSRQARNINRETVDNLRFQIETQPSKEEPNMAAPSMPPKKGKVGAGTVGKVANGVTTRRKTAFDKENNYKEDTKSKNAASSQSVISEASTSSTRIFVKSTSTAKVPGKGAYAAIMAKGKASNSTRNDTARKSFSNNTNTTFNDDMKSVSAVNKNLTKGQQVDRRRSNVVKEVDQMKKNREERRVKQAEVLGEKAAQKNIDPGNPNWEFLCMIREYQDTLQFNPLKDGDALIDNRISVCVRKRPLSSKEVTKKEVDVICTPNPNQVILHEPKAKVDLTKYLENQQFRFDYAFDETASNELVYKYTAKPLVQNVFEGGMATCFAYGQTGSGKTHTMGGEFHGKTQDSKNGIYAMATKDVFNLLASSKYKNLKLQVSCSYFEIYSGKLFDLLNGKSKLRVLEDGKQQVIVVGLSEKSVTCLEDVLKYIGGGNNLRTSGQTSANAHSSRSHAVFQLILRNTNLKKTLHGKFSLIDLAGNERGADTSSADRQTRMEGAEINKSLLALKECIRALGRKGSHLPFRASKLTQVLRDSFIGEKSKTCMIAMVSPTLSCCENSLNTMRYADRVKELGAADSSSGRQTENGQRQAEDSNGHFIDTADSASAMLASRDRVANSEDADLAQIRSLNEAELSADWYTFQEAITRLQILEEELVESHKSTVDGMEQWTNDGLSLINITNGIDYDQDAYCQQLEDMLSEKINTLTSLRDKARNFRKCLNDEEAKSRQLRNRND